MRKDWGLLQPLLYYANEAVLGSSCCLIDSISVLYYTPVFVKNESASCVRTFVFRWLYVCMVILEEYTGLKEPLRYADKLF